SATSCRRSTLVGRARGWRPRGMGWSSFATPCVSSRRADVHVCSFKTQTWRSVLRHRRPSMSFTPEESAACETLARLALDEDLAGAGGWTSLAVIPQGRVGRAVFVARSAGVLAGLPAARLVFALVDPTVQFEERVADGTALAPGSHLAVVSGPMRSILVG